MRAISRSPGAVLERRSRLSLPHPILPVSRAPVPPTPPPLKRPTKRPRAGRPRTINRRRPTRRSLWRFWVTAEETAAARILPAGRPRNKFCEIFTCAFFPIEFSFPPHDSKIPFPHRCFFLCSPLYCCDGIDGADGRRCDGGGSGQGRERRRGGAVCAGQGPRPRRRLAER